MYPLIGPMTPTALGWLIAGAVGGGTVLSSLSRMGLTARQIAVQFGALVASLFVGSKLLYLVEAWPQSATAELSFASAVFSPQMRIPGGFLLAIALGPLVARLTRVGFLQI